MHFIGKPIGEFESVASYSLTTLDYSLHHERQGPDDPITVKS
jgi:hypothetical protein